MTPRSWLLVVVAGVFLLAALAILANSVLFPTYTASALIAIEANPQYIASRATTQSGDGERYVQSQVELIRSPVVLELLLARPSIARYKGLADNKDSMAHLRSKLSVERIGDSDLFRISYTSASPAHAKEVANAVVAEYIKIQSQSEYERSLKVIQLLENERQRRRLVVDDLRRKVVKLAAEVTGVDPLGSGAILNVDVEKSQSSKLYERLSDLKVRRAILQKQIDRRHNPPPHAPENVDAATAGEDASDDEADAAAPPADPDEIAKLKRQLEELDVECEAVTELLEAERKNLEAGQRKVVELSFTRDDLAREVKVLETIENRKLALQTESRAPARITVRQQAAIPTVPSRWIQEPTPAVVITVGSLTIATLALMALAFMIRAPQRP